MSVIIICGLWRQASFTYHNVFRFYPHLPMNQCLIPFIAQLYFIVCLYRISLSSVGGHLASMHNVAMSTYVQIFV